MAARVEVLDTDITTLAVDAIANAANTELRHGGGVARAIAVAAGPELEAPVLRGSGGWRHVRWDGAGTGRGAPGRSLHGGRPRV